MAATPPGHPYFLRRIGAAAYDALICSGILLGIGIAFTLLMGGGSAELRGPGPAGRALLQTLLVLTPVAYFVGSWARGGQTIGLRAWRIRVAAPDGGPVSLKAGLIRFFAAFLAWAPAGLGVFWSLFDRERLAWHDRISGTQLTYTPASAGTQKQDTAQ
ncbi:MAG TPA: RDD family protein [Gammaproteobacteria bacterium]|nr:RDD family protein [Gammaproteobacteria bacterium]